MWIYWALLIPLVVVSFLVGYFYKKKEFENSLSDYNTLIQFNKILVKAFSSIGALLNVEQLIANLTNSLKTSLFKEIWLIRYDGYNFVETLRGVSYNDDGVRDFAKRFLNPNEESDDYIDCTPENVFIKLYLKEKATNAPVNLRVYPISLHFIGVTYFLLFFSSKPIQSKESNQFLLFVKRNFFLLLYLKELSLKYKESQEFLDGVFHNNPISISITDKEGYIIRGNKEFYRLFTTGMKNIRDILDEGFYQSLLLGNMIDKDVAYDQKNLKVRGLPLYELNGQIKGFLFSITNETLQQLLYRRLESSEERYKRLLKELPLGLIIINQDGIIYFVNDNFMYSLGFSSPEKLQGKVLEDFFELPYKNFAELAEQIDKKEYLYFKFQSKPRYGSRIFSVNLRKLNIGSDNLIEAAFQDVTLENALYAQLEEKNAMIEEELSTARGVWEHILSIPPLYSAVLRFETFYKASSQLGGDFYDIIQIDDTHVAVVIADASGHGVSASLVASMLKILVEFAPKDPHKLSDIVDYINNGLLKVLPADQYITMFYGVIDTQNYMMEYINCGHPYPLIYDDKSEEIVQIRGMSFPLGSNLNFSYENDLFRVQLPESCKLLFYTDGLTTFKIADRIMNIGDIVRFFEESAHFQTKDILNSIYMKVQKSATQFTDDDISMLLLVFNKNLAYKKYLSIPSNVLEIDYALMRIKEGLNLLFNFNDEDSWKLYTALYEALINAVEHGNKFNVQRRVTVNYRIIKNWIVFKIRDEGAGFDVESVPNPLADENIMKPSGRGVFMIKKLMHKVKYNSTGNEATMFFQISPQSELK